jgi:NAD(P)-dependent dehydrogenase (short-subunit alcohol dehydrogenase family)
MATPSSKPVVLVTGSSSGIGKATALYFAERGWQVVATMRTPAKAPKELQSGNSIVLTPLDVIDNTSIETALQDTITRFGKIDAIVNNAGYGAVGAFEAATDEQIRRQFDTNVFGLMNVVRGILPHFRARKQGTIINVASMGGRIAFPIYSIYHGTKWAVDGFSESLQYELAQFGIRVKIIEPGAIKTDFYDRSMDVLRKDGLTDYDHYVNVAFKNSQAEGDKAPGPEVVAKTIFLAATDNSTRLRYVTGTTLTKVLMLLRRILPHPMFAGIIKSVVEKGL